jgi:hypothetical protein
MNPVVLIHLLLSVGGALVAAIVIVYGRVSHGRLARQFTAGPPRRLTAEERGRLAAWGRRDVLLYVITMGYLTVFSLALAWLPAELQLGGEILLVVLVVALVVGHFSMRCPICARSLGLQSGLGLPHCCEICRAPFRPDSVMAQLAGRLAGGKPPTRYRSHRTLWGLPLVAVAIGPDLAAGQARGIAKGLIAVGDIAIGGVAVGGLACGAIAVGGAGVGGLAIGGLAFGLAALGGLAIGGVAIGGAAAGIVAVGGLAVGVYSHGGVAIGLRPRGGVNVFLPFR